jgi:ATP-binding cassette, subfamily C, bacterial CydD
MYFDRRLLPYLREIRRPFIIAVSIGLLTAIGVILQADVLSFVVARAFLQRASISPLLSPLYVLLAVIIFRASLSSLAELITHRMGARVKLILRQKLLDHLFKLGPAFTSGERTGELGHTITEGLESIEGFFNKYLPQLILAVLVPALILFFVFPRDLISGLIMLLTAPLIPVFMILIGNLAEGRTKKQWQALSLMSAHFLDTLQGLKTLKLFGWSRKEADIIFQISERYRLATMGILKIAFTSSLALELIATISTAIVAVGLGLRLIVQQIDFQTAFFILLLTPEFYGPLRSLGIQFHAAIAGKEAAGRILEILETPFVSASPTEGAITAVPELKIECIEFKDVCFAYDGGQRPALQHFSAAFNAGEISAVIGPSGSGKSTILNLLMRFISPQSGMILVNGQPLAAIPPAHWRAHMAWVPQQPYLFNTSILENIRLSRPSASLAEVEKAAESAQAAEFIRALPDGYDTLVGEEGCRLSAGQAQRLSLARAFLKDAPLIVFDEATSYLDYENEALIQQAASFLMRERMVIVIAHRLSTAYRADNIVMLSEGHLAASGRHAVLLEQSAAYRRLIAAYGGEP